MKVYNVAFGDGKLGLTCKAIQPHTSPDDPFRFVPSFVIVLGVAGQAAGLGCHVGDVIIAVNGHPFVRDGFSYDELLEQGGAKVKMEEK